jgi:di/tricarboxylate transporter
MAVPYYALLAFGAGVLWLTSRSSEHVRRPSPDGRPPEPLAAPARRTVGILLLTTGLWLTDAWHGLNPAIPALLAALLLVAPGVGVLAWRQLEARLSWELVLTVGASLSLAAALNTTSAASWLAGWLGDTVVGLREHPSALVAALIVIVVVVHLGVANLAACLALLLPIVTTTTAAAGLNPLAVGLIVTVVVDAVILYPVQTATNLLAYQAGYFSTADVRRFGVVMLGLTLVVIFGITIPYWRMVGLPLLME